MLLQLEHEHKGKEEPPSPQKSEPIGSSRVTKKADPVPEEQPSIFFVPQPIVETASFNFHTDGLEELRRESVGELGGNVVEAIRERKRFSEERVYQAIVQTSADFVGIHMRDFRTGLKLEMQAMFEGIHNTVEAGIWDGRYEINESRNKYFSLATKEKELLSFITAQLVKRNLDSFRQELDEGDLASDSVDAAHSYADAAQSYHAKSENYKTRAAEDFVRRMREEQTRHQSQINRQIEERRALEHREAEARQAKEEQRLRERGEFVRRRAERRSEIMGLQRERRQKMHSEYLKMVSGGRKPLFQESEERYSRAVMEEQKRKFGVMQELKEQKRPINFDEIQEHMARYEELLQENESFRQQKRELKESEFEVIASNRPYRSKFYTLTLAPAHPDQAQQQHRTALLRKQEDYADHVKRNFMPRADEAKQQELEQLIQRIDHHKRHNYHSRKYVEEGKRNLEKLHLLIAELRAKNKLKENIAVTDLEPRQPIKRYKNYLEDIKQAKGDAESVDFEAKLAHKSHEEVRMLSMLREEKARQKERYLEHSIEDIDIHSHMRGKSMVEQDYIQAAKAKLALLKQYSQPANQDAPAPDA